MSLYDDACAFCGGLGDPSESSNHRLGCVFLDSLDALSETSASVDKLVAEREALRARVEELEAALRKCNDLFTEIRGDWSDPRSGCREGWAVISAALEPRSGDSSGSPSALRDMLVEAPHASHEELRTAVEELRARCASLEAALLYLGGSMSGSPSTLRSLLLQMAGLAWAELTPSRMMDGARVEAWVDCILGASKGGGR